nr:unnamed protein product [Callosobruchus chinensis]
MCGEAVETAKHVIFDVLPCAEEEARIWKLSRRREDSSTKTSGDLEILFQEVESRGENHHFIMRLDCYVMYFENITDGEYKYAL